MRKPDRPSLAEASGVALGRWPADADRPPPQVLHSDLALGQILGHPWQLGMKRGLASGDAALSEADTCPGTPCARTSIQPCAGSSIPTATLCSASRGATAVAPLSMRVSTSSALCSGPQPRPSARIPIGIASPGCGARFVPATTVAESPDSASARCRPGTVCGPDAAPPGRTDFDGGSEPISIAGAAFGGASAIGSGAAGAAGAAAAGAAVTICASSTGRVPTAAFLLLLSLLS